MAGRTEVSSQSHWGLGQASWERAWGQGRRQSSKGQSQMASRRRGTRARQGQDLGGGAQAPSSEDPGFPFSSTTHILWPRRETSGRFCVSSLGMGIWELPAL